LSYPHQRPEWIDFFSGRVNPEPEILDAALGVKALALGDILLCEVLQGYRHVSDFEKAREALLRFPVFPIGGTRIAVKSGENYRLLRRQGITVCRTIDCLIATFVIEHGFALLHNDRDFDPFEQHLGLEVVRHDRPANPSTVSNWINSGVSRPTPDHHGFAAAISQNLSVRTRVDPPRLNSRIPMLSSRVG
jgi:predicted nucleic acid-binding protein